MGRLTGKIALITGTGGGQGRAAALLFAQEGASVVGCDTNGEAANETVDLVRSAGGLMTSTSPIDLADKSDAHRWVEASVRAFGGIDILYNNAGAVRFAPLADLSLEDWHFTIRNELDLIFVASQAVWPHLIRRGGGTILNTASVAGMIANRKVGSVSHAAAKGGVIAMTRKMAAEGAAHNIRANTISPGPIETPAIKVLDQAVIESVREDIPLGRWGKPEDVAYCALYLASDEARWVTGANIAIDGGTTAVR